VASVWVLMARTMSGMLALAGKFRVATPSTPWMSMVIADPMWYRPSAPRAVSPATKPNPIRAGWAAEVTITSTSMYSRVPNLAPRIWTSASEFQFTPLVT